MLRGSSSSRRIRGVASSVRRLSGSPKYVDARKFKPGESSGGGIKAAIFAFATGASAYATYRFINPENMENAGQVVQDDGGVVENKLPSPDVSATLEGTQEATAATAVEETNEDETDRLVAGIAAQEEQSVVDVTNSSSNSNSDSSSSSSSSNSTSTSSSTSSSSSSSTSSSSSRGSSSDSSSGADAVDTVDVVPTVQLEAPAQTAPQYEPEPTSPPAPVRTEPAFDVKDITLPQVASERSASELHDKCSAASVDEIVMHMASSHADVEAALLSNIGEADSETLRIRIAQLTAELLEQSKWQPVRLAQAIRKLESDVSERYAALMTQQRRELESEAARLSVKVEQELLAKHADELAVLRRDLEADTARALGEQATALNSMALQARKQMQADLAEKYNLELSSDVAEMRQQHTVEQLEALNGVYAGLESLRATIAAAGPLGGTESGICEASMHRRLAAVLDAERVLSSGKASSAGDKMTALRQAFKGDTMAESVLDTLPEVLRSGGRASTFAELKTGFTHVRGEVVKASLIPSEAPGAVGYAIGSVLSLFTRVRRGLVPGDRPEEIISRMSFHLDNGRLDAAVKEGSRLEGPAREAANEWLSRAQDRLVCDQGLDALKARSIASPA